MIDDPAVRAALEGVLSAGPIPPEHIARLGDHSFTPPDGPHLRTALVWQRKAKTGAVLTEGEGIWQVLVYAPEGTPAAAIEALAIVFGMLYETYVDGPQLADFVRITDVQLTSTADGQDGDAMGGRRWVIASLQIDFRLELIPDGLA